MKKRVFGLFCAALVLVACAETDRMAVMPTASPTTTATISPPASAAARKDCGTYILLQAETVPKTAYRCFIEAVGSRRPAQLKETRPTAEGDPIPVTYIANAQGRVEMTVDSRKDNFGTKLVTRQMCNGPIVREGHLTFANCAKAQPAS